MPGLIRQTSRVVTSVCIAAAVTSSGCNVFWQRVDTPPVAPGRIKVDAVWHSPEITGDMIEKVKSARLQQIQAVELERGESRSVDVDRTMVPASKSSGELSRLMSSIER